MARNRTQLLNFRQPRKSARSGDAGFTDAQQVSYLKSLYLKSIGGEFRNAEDLRGYVDFLKGFESTPEVQVEIAQREAEAEAYNNDQQEIFSSVSQMKDRLNDSLRTAMNDSGGDLNKLLSSQALIYSSFFEQVDSFAAETLKNYKSNTQLGDDYYKFKDELRKKSEELTGLSVQLNDPRLTSSFDPETVSLQITTNPSTGVISDVKFVPRGEVDKGFVETDIKMKVNQLVPAVPVSINAIDNGSTPDGTQKRMARLGDMKLFGTFKKSAQDDKELGKEYGLFQLKAQDSAGFTPFRKTPVEQGRKEGFELNQFKTDGNDIGSGAVVRRGTRLFYTAEDGSLQEFEGESYNDKVSGAYDFLVNLGDPFPEKAYYPKPVSDQFLNSPDPAGGRASRIITPIGRQSYVGKNPMAVPEFSAPTPMSMETNMSSESAPLASSETPAQTGFFANRVNRQNKPDVSKESSNGRSFIGDVIDKGRSFFRKVA